MSIFNNHPADAGHVSQQAHPNPQRYPWVPNKHVSAQPNIRAKRIGPEAPTATFFRKRTFQELEQEAKASRLESMFNLTQPSVIVPGKPPGGGGGLGGGLDVGGAGGHGHLIG